MRNPFLAGFLLMISVSSIAGPSTKPSKATVYLVDGTGSVMSQFDSMRVYLRAAISELKPGQTFNVITYNEAIKAANKSLVDATDEEKRFAFDFLDNFSARGPADATADAYKAAVKMHPDRIMLVGSSGQYDRKAMAKIKAANPGKIRTDAVVFGTADGDEGVNQLVDLTAEFGGKCVDPQGRALAKTKIHDPPVTIKP